MINLDDQLKILREYKSGSEIQYSKMGPQFPTWLPLVPEKPTCHIFNFENYSYRSKPKPPKWLSILEKDYTCFEEGETGDTIRVSVPAYLEEPGHGTFTNYVHQDFRKVKYLRVSKRSNDGLTKCRMFDELEQAREGSALNDNSYVIKILLLEM